VSTNYKAERVGSQAGNAGKGALELLSNTVSARSQPEMALRILPAA